jgi:integrase/recombinase XerC/integrase/recombinase XerD
MHHPDSLFTDPSYAALDLRRLAAEFDRWCRGRSKPVKAKTRAKYQWALGHLFRSMEEAGTQLELRYLHPTSIDTWVGECRAAGRSEDGIASDLSAVKIFANGYVTKHLELTIVDSLRKVSRITPPDRAMEVLSEAELEQVLAVFGDSYEDVRSRAFLAVLMATGAWLMEVGALALDQYDAISGELIFFGKGDRVRYAKLSDRSHRCLKAYLKLRPKQRSNALWLKRDGSEMTYWGWQSLFRRLKKRTGIERLHAHLLRHTFGSGAIEKGAERAAVQDMLGHESDYMTRR